MFYGQYSCLLYPPSKYTPPAFSCPAVQPRHWQSVMKVTGTKFDVTGSEFTLSTLPEAHIAKYAEEIEEICESATKQLGISSLSLSLSLSPSLQFNNLLH